MIADVGHDDLGNCGHVKVPAKGRRLQSLSVISANGGGWGPFLGVIRDNPNRIVCGQEARLAGTDIPDRQASMMNGEHVALHASPCDVSDCGGKSGGVAISVPTFMGSDSFDRYPSILDGRACFTHVDAWLPGGVVILDGYFFSGEGLTTRNWLSLIHI